MSTLPSTPYALYGLLALLFFTAPGCEPEDDGAPGDGLEACTQAGSVTDRGYVIEPCQVTGSEVVPNTLESVKNDVAQCHGPLVTTTCFTGDKIELPGFPPEALIKYQGRTNYTERGGIGFMVPFIDGQYWKWVIPWGNLYWNAAAETQPANVRVELRNLRGYWFNQDTKEWIELFNTPNDIVGAIYDDGFSDDTNYPATTDLTCSSQLVDLPPNGNVYHFYASERREVSDPAACRGFFVTYQARLIRSFCGEGGDGRPEADLYCGAGLDVWDSQFRDGNDPTFQYHGDAMFGRHRKLTEDWQSFNGLAMQWDEVINPDLYPPPFAD